MKTVKTLFSLTLLFLALTLQAQKVSVTGQVSDAETGEGIPFAGVFIKGTTTGVASDDQGSFIIDVSKGDILLVSSIGYVEQEVTVESGRKIIVKLRPDSQAIDETIVVAYGVQKKSSFVGSAAQVSGDKLQKMQSTNISKSLEGAVAGLQTSSSSGTPGSSASIIIRGLGSVSASQAPLLVVDGVPYEGSLNSIPTHDIESMTVLKDAAANSMYGARGSNGVIIITTRRGTSDKVRIEFDAKVGVNSRGVPTYDIVTSPADYYEMTWESLRNEVYYGGSMGLGQANAYASGSLISKYLRYYNIYKGVEDGEVVLPGTGKINPAATERKWTDDWNKDVFKRGVRQEYTLTVSGGSEKTRAYMSVSYLNDKGYVPNSGFSRVTVRGKVDQSISKFIKAGLNIAYSNTNQDQFGAEKAGSYSNIFFFGQNIAPIYPIYKYDLETGERLFDQNGGDLYDWGEQRAYGQLSNPYGQLLSSVVNTVRDNTSSRGYVDINILDGLKFTVNVAYDIFNTKSDNFFTPVGGDASTVNGRGTQSTSRYTALNTNQLLSYNKDLGREGQHSVSLLLGHEIKSDHSYGLAGSMTNFVDPTVSDFANAVVYQELTSSRTSYFL